MLKKFQFHDLMLKFEYDNFKDTKQSKYYSPKMKYESLSFWTDTKNQTVQN